MDLIRFGRSIRALRMRRKWRQIDLALAAHVSRAKVVRIELGQSDAMPVRDLDSVAQVLGARTDLRLSWNGEALDRLLDGEHAGVVETVARMLRSDGWDVAVEVTFWIRVERGSIDVLGWHPRERIVLVVEVKSVVPDQQAMLAALDRKLRLGLEIGRERGLEGVAAARLLVIKESRTSRRRIEAFRATYDAAFPQRSTAVRAWLRRPSATGRFSGLLFLSDVHGASTRHRVPRQDRVS
jgi:transcriptional regulator with XRE-family HTH domain